MNKILDEFRKHQNRCASDTSPEAFKKSTRIPTTALFELTLQQWPLALRFTAFSPKK